MLDNYDLWKMHEAEQEKKLARLPKCCLCREPIQQDMAVCINGEWYCDNCLEESREDTEMHME